MSIRSFLVERLVNTAFKSWTAGVAVVIGAAGVTASIDPKLLELIPEKYRGLAISLVAIVVLVARLRTELMAAFKGKIE